MPWIQLKAWNTSGIVVARRPPKMMALIGTPAGSSAAESRTGLFAWGGETGIGMRRDTAAPGVHSLPVQSVNFSSIWQPERAASSVLGTR